MSNCLLSSRHFSEHHICTILFNSQVHFIWITIILILLIIFEIKKDVKKSPKITKHPVDSDQIRIQDVWFLHP